MLTQRELRKLDLNNQDTDLKKRLDALQSEIDVIEARRKAIDFELDLLNEMEA